MEDVLLTWRGSCCCATSPYCAAKTAVSRIIRAKNRTNHRSNRSSTGHSHWLANSTPISKTLLPVDRRIRDIFLRGTFGKSADGERKPIFLTVVCGFSGSFVRQETAAYRQIFDEFDPATGQFVRSVVVTVCPEVSFFSLLFLFLFFKPAFVFQISFSDARNRVTSFGFLESF